MSINKDQVKGLTNEVIGKIKQATGEVVGNKKLEVQGVIQKNIGIIQAKVGKIKSGIAKA